MNRASEIKSIEQIYVLTKPIFTKPHRANEYKAPGSNLKEYNCKDCKCFLTDLSQFKGPLPERCKQCKDKRRTELKKLCAVLRYTNLKIKQLEITKPQTEETDRQIKFLIQKREFVRGELKKFER